MATVRCKNTDGKGNVIYVDYEVEEYIEEITYTAEQLSAMTNAELSAILADMGISGSMTKANMIALILDKQSQT